MNKIIAILFFTLLLSNTTTAKYKRMASMQVSFNQIELGFRHHIIADKFWANVYTDLGNQDVNSEFDDFTLGLGLGYNAFSFKKHQIALNSGIGLYVPNNSYYSVTVPVINAGLQYSRFLGQTDKHCLLVSTGYRYGKRDYKQVYSSEIANASTIGTFKHSPIYFSIGYGLRF
jgi:hypothetical protein